MAAHKPKPTRMKILEGNPGRRPLPENEVQPLIDDVLPKAPEYLSEPAKKEWYVMGEKLHRLGLLTQIDYPAFAIYCQSYGHWVEAEEAVEKTGFVIRTTTGKVIESPMVSISKRSMRLAHKFLSEFGMTPRAPGRKRY